MYVFFLGRKRAFMCWEVRNKFKFARWSEFPVFPLVRNSLIDFLHSERIHFPGKAGKRW